MFVDDCNKEYWSPQLSHLIHTGIACCARYIKALEKFKVSLGTMNYTYNHLIQPSQGYTSKPYLENPNEIE